MDINWVLIGEITSGSLIIVGTAIFLKGCDAYNKNKLFLPVGIVLLFLCLVAIAASIYAKPYSLTLGVSMMLALVIVAVFHKRLYGF